MIFYVRKMLPSGLVRFGVAERAAEVPASGSEMFSTGPAGEYLRRSQGGLYFAEERGEAPAQLMPSEWSIRRRSSLSIGAKILIGVGALILLLGILLLANKGDPIAWIEIVLGLAMIGTPIVRTARLRRELRAQAERERVEREETEKRNREIVGEFAQLLEALRSDHGPAALQRVRAARQGRDIPYQAVAPMARQTARLVGFEILSGFPTLDADGVAREMESMLDAIGLQDEDRRLVQRHLWQKLVWHLLADDRMGDGHREPLERLRKALNIEPAEIQKDGEAIRQFSYLRGLTVPNLPRVDSPVPLKFQEVCHHRTRGELLKMGRRGQWHSSGERTVVVTSRRVVVANQKLIDLRFEEIFELEVDADLNLLTIVTGDQDKIHTVRISDPIYTAGVIAIASKTPRKPKGLV
jgi:hypothetical protein